MPVLDFFHQELKVDDFVLFGTPMNQGRGFDMGRVVGFTPKKVKVVTNTKSWRGTHEKLLYSEELFKLDERLVVLYTLKQK